MKSRYYPEPGPLATVLSSILTPERVGEVGVLCPTDPRSGVGMNKVVFVDGSFEYFGTKEIEVNPDILQPIPPHGIELSPDFERPAPSLPLAA